MATSKILKRHISNNKSIIDSLADSFNYGKNPLKTLDGRLITTYMCKPETADSEFLLSKAQYKASTGREQKKNADVLYYQIRQSFVPGEVDSETALKIGYDLAMRWTKGKHAFFVASHIDRPHPHVHIYYNSITLDCTHKYRDFLGSARALRRLSDRICLENGLSVITDPKLKSKGKFKHYGEWINGNKQPTFKDRLKEQIDLILSTKPSSMEAFFEAMKQAGYEIKHGRGGMISLGIQGQEKFTRLRTSTLGEGYGLEDIRATIEGRLSSGSGKIIETKKVNLIIDIQSKIKSGKGPAYQKWATVYNLKQMAATLQYLQENDLLEYSQLERLAVESTDRFHNLTDKIKSLETALNTNSELKVALADYAKTRAVFDGYRTAKYSNQYLAEHETDIQLYRASQATFRRILNGEKLPKMDTLKKEYRRLMTEKNTAYKEYREIKKCMQDTLKAKHNIDHLLGLTSGQINKGMER